MNAVDVSEEKGQAYKRWFCKCVTKHGKEVFLVARATTEAQASHYIHNNYAIDYIEDIYTPLQMEYLKRHLRPTIMKVQQYQ